ncbi:MAG TPA: alpha/beta fold hydrolase [Solirubrobacteraceae bacterium]|nr:alpha/beta fold hydrolase [Solirubrobacteraceae bacterium]
MRTVNVEPPTQIGTRDGLAYALFLPPGPPRGGVVVLHGAGSCKESHYDFARRCRTYGFAAVAFDQRGHGASEGALDARAAADIAAMAELLPPGVPRALRGSSMGGYLALVGAEAARADAVVAICPASAAQLRRGLRAGAFTFRAAEPGLDAFLAEHDELAAAEGLSCPLLLMHAEGDEQVPAEHSRELHAACERSRLVVVPGGDHRSVQHDDELQDLSVRFIRKAFGGARG